MKAIKISGLIIFAIGFFLFSASNFMASYRLTGKVLREKIPDDKKRDLFTEEASGVIDKTFTSNRAFVSALDEIFDRVNERQLERYNISDSEIAGIIEKSRDRFTTPVLDSVFRTSNEIAAFKNEAFRKHASELEGQSFESGEEYEARLREVAVKIREYGIINQVGFDRYAIRDLKYTLTKASDLGQVKWNPA
jgi:hypothetical protein